MAGRSVLYENGKFPGDRLFGARSDPRTQDMNAMQPAAVNGARVSPPMVTTLLRAGPRLKHALARPVFRRKVTSITMMRAMHVTQAMAEFLGLYVDGTASIETWIYRNPRSCHRVRGVVCGAQPSRHRIPNPTPPGDVTQRPLFEPFFCDFFKDRKTGARGREKKVESQEEISLVSEDK